MIIFYSRTCESCSGNRALTLMEAECKKYGVSFEQRRTVLWEKWKEEAEDIAEVCQTTLPFFYSTEANEAIHGSSFLPVEELRKLIKLDLEEEQK